MIVGNGLLASAFEDSFKEDSKVIVFASGVSNSQEKSEAAFLREKNLLTSVLEQDKFIIYFSSCSIEDDSLSKAPYVLHKKSMEMLVKSASNYAILRLPQVVGKTNNPHTLTNYLYQKIFSNEPFQVWQYAERNLIDVKDIALISTYLYKTAALNKVTLNIACPYFTPILELVSIFELVLRKKANFTLLEAGGSYRLDTTLGNEAAKKMGINFNDDYIEKLIRKYYAKT
jgi:nucleoside-diphosphate-sugar epimerase